MFVILNISEFLRVSHAAKLAGLLTQDNRTDVGIPVFWTKCQRGIAKLRSKRRGGGASAKTRISTNPRSCDCNSSKRTKEWTSVRKSCTENEEMQDRGPKNGHNIYFFSLKND